MHETDKNATVSRLFSALGERRASLVHKEICTFLAEQSVCAVFVHGSFSREQADEYSDLDIVVITEDDAINSQISAFQERFERERLNAVRGQSDRFPWFGHLESVMYPGEIWFVFEVGFVKRSKLNEFYVEPDAWVIKDIHGVVDKRREECIAERVTTAQVEKKRLGYEILNLAIKFEKAIKRKHLWNASNYCSIARRLLFDLIRSAKFGDEKIFVGIVERRIESELGIDAIREFNYTTPRYCSTELTEIFIKLFDAIIARASHFIDEELLSWLHVWRSQQPKADW